MPRKPKTPVALCSVFLIGLTLWFLLPDHKHDHDHRNQHNHGHGHGHWRWHGHACHATKSCTSSTPTPLSLEKFDAWLQDADPAHLSQDEELLHEGVLLAQQRRADMLELIQSDPQVALDQALSFAEYHALPPEIQELVEEPFTVRAEFQVRAICFGDHEGSDLDLAIRFGNGEKKQLAEPNQKRVSLAKAKLPTQGIKLESWAAIHPTVFHQLSEQDLAWAASNLPLANLSPEHDILSGEEIPDQPIVAIAGGYRFHFASQETLRQLETNLHELDQLPGIDIGSPAFLSQVAAKFEPGSFDLEEFAQFQETSSLLLSNENKPYLVIRVDFPDKLGTPFTKEELEQMGQQRVAPALAEYSFGRTTVELTATEKIYTLSNSANYTDYDVLFDHAVAAYQADGNPSPLSQYDIICVSFPDLSFGWAGIASVGGYEQWLQGRVSDETMLHEIGHNYGLMHANYWDHDHHHDPVNPAGSNEEYGDIFDVMGDGPTNSGHFHMAAKQFLGWIETDRWGDLSSAADNGVYRIYPFDRASDSGLQALRVFKSTSNDHYWIGYRGQQPGVANFDRGLYLVWERRDGSTSRNQSWLVDTTPGSEAGKVDAGVALGRTYADASSQLFITPVAQGEDANGPYIDVSVNFGQFPNNLDPSGTLSAPTVGAARVPILFTFEGSDPDDDPLSYQWDFGDGIVENSQAAVSHAFPVGGSYQISLTVSDRKGGTQTLNSSIEISDPISEVAVRQSGTTADLHSLAANHSHVVAVGSSNSARRSADGISWEPHPIPQSNGSVRLRDIIWTGQNFVAVGAEYDFSLGGWLGVIHTSPNGETWTAAHRTTEKVGSWGFNSVAANSDGSTIVVIGSDARIYTQTNGGAWTPIEVGRNLNGWSNSANVTFADGTFVIGGYDYNADPKTPLVLLASLNGLDWQDLAEGSGIAVWQGLSTVAAPNGKLMGSGFRSRMRYSENGGATWTTNQQGDIYEAVAYAYGNGVYSAAVYREDGVNSNDNRDHFNMLSIDGKNWSLSGETLSVDYNDRIFFKDTFISVGDDGVIHQTASFSAPVKTAFAIWMENYPIDLADQGHQANPDGDWASNLLEYALGSDPSDRNSVPAMPEISQTSDGKVRAQIHRFSRTNSTLSLEFSQDMQTWALLPTEVAVDSGTLLALVSEQSLNDQERYFIRLKVTP